MNLDLVRNSQVLKLPCADEVVMQLQALLPVQDEENILSLGEGNTVLQRAKTISQKLGLRSVWVKDESFNATGSFKARGLSVAVSRAKELGITEVVIPTAGNAGGAMAAYAARGKLGAHVFMPRDTASVFVNECRLYGADVTLVAGVITDCGKIVGERKESEGWFDVSTLKEPYRLEGKKTMGYELAFQFGWELPDVILYPTGGGTGLIGMWKAFDEMETLGWIGPKRPRMVVVQSSGCAPMVKAFQEGKSSAEMWEGAQTFALGLRVPKAVGDFLILRIVQESRGTAVAVSDDAIFASMREMGAWEGILACPEGGATLAALKHLREIGWVYPDDRVVLFNTGTGLKYFECFKDRME